jgi:hypothetical protein
MVQLMDRGDAVTYLPTLHAVAIRLRDEGADAHTIAVATGVDDDQVAGMLEVAEAKLVRLMKDGDR